MSDWQRDRAIVAILMINFFLILVSAGVYGILNPKEKKRSFTKAEVEQIQRCFAALEGKE